MAGGRVIETVAYFALVGAGLALAVREIVKRGPS